MEVFHNISDISNLPKPAVITLGNFEGIHNGHRKIIETCINEARKIGAHCVVVTYDHSRSVIFKERPEFIYVVRERIRLIESLGVDYLLLIPFSEEIKNIAAKDFLQSLLIEKLKAKLIIIGYDHRFGKNREGNIDFLREYSAEFGYDVRQMEPVEYEGRIISSSRIRSNLVMGDIEKANAQLGCPYHITGTVTKGFQRGTQIGFPTANIETPARKLIPAEGVYAGQIELDDKRKYFSVINIGHNPTFNNKKLTVEAHILDFNESIYDKEVTLYLLKKIRDEVKFKDSATLTDQIYRDIHDAAIYFKSLKK